MLDHWDLHHVVGVLDPGSDALGAGQVGAVLAVLLDQMSGGWRSSL
jgi:hypothetical protein